MRGKMRYSYTQLASYLRCPRSYRFRYLDGWREKETRAAMAFGRCFEKALAAYFCGGDCSATLFKEWGAYRDTPFAYKKGETWDRMVHQGVHLLERFAQDNRVRIVHPQQDLQLKVVRELPNGNEFISYIDAIGELDGNRCLMDWKTTSSRYPDSPEGLLSLDPQLICYSWITGITTWHSSFSCENMSRKFSIFERRSPKNNVMNLVGCLKRQLVKSRPPSFPPTAASAFRKTAVSVVHIWVCASTVSP